ncbi:valine--tRNA ligase [Sandaracinobacter sp. RS1-74]|uniref:valine--tRNA ligase n=1 Tax=Sandaracinobacteroides sayramensis TaxID=2913411 RepID=UPI001EDB4FC9|nr:valine--tRNA ligase [Sandaracinobacteroides sayramensis]MCG2840367.1 valine--tRNA ligase [Sandaracinobacteroides sayramensis]
MLEKTFTPAEIEARWYAHWESTGAFRPSRPEAKPFTILLPPPNVTGTLHIGHALNQTLQDILIRWQRLKGADARWIVGTDHAGIATQMVVERTIAGQGLTRQSMGRAAFLETVWEWKGQSGGAITRQMRRLGASCDWANERFTMDPAFNKAVVEVFVRLHEAGLIYRDKRLVNWDPKLKTAISDLEVETREVQGHFWHIRYPLADGVRLSDGRDYIVVATTRPETILADMLVAVHPDDERYRSVVGQHVILPITGRRVRIVADVHADPELGSGCVKITPGHDFNDFEVGRRAGIAPAEMLNMFDAEANIVQIYEEREEWGVTNYGDDELPDIVEEPTRNPIPTIPQEFIGLHRFEAREAIVAALNALGLLERVEAKIIQTPFGDRSGVVIEPWLTDQWYVDAAKLAVEARAAVEDGRTRFVPATWEKTYFNWMENIQPWCVSRQLWWGHRIPVWYGPWRSDDPDRPTPTSIADNDLQTKPFIARDFASAVTLAQEYYRDYYPGDYIINEAPDEADVSLQNEFLHHTPLRILHLKRDADVLDTWFSSGLWPFVTLGWPDQNEDLKRCYPSSVLVTGFDIIFFWVARMMMFGLQIMDEEPFETVYIHGLVRDAKGQKMSKSKGNTVDPLELIDRFGADALRFTMAASEAQGRDVKFDEKRVEGYRNFATKLWNAARFAESQGIKASPSPEPPAATHAVNRWIIAETAKAAADAEAALTAYRFDQYALQLYQFVWSRYCDWYLELIKPLLAEGGDLAEETRAVAGWALDRILVLLHPAMPFLTEELWHALGERQQDLIVAGWPDLDAGTDEAGAEIGWLIELVSAIRSARTELNVPPAAKLALHSNEVDSALIARLERHRPALERLARIDTIATTPAPAGGVAQLVVEGCTYALPLEGVIDLAAERARLQKAAEQAEKEAAALDGRLSNPGFVERAKPEAVEKAREDHAARSAEAERLRAALARLG